MSRLPVYVGHSFGGLLPLLFPELEKILKGLIILGPSPKIDFSEARALRSTKGIIIPPEPGREFIKKSYSRNIFTILASKCSLSFSSL